MHGRTARRRAIERWNRRYWHSDRIPPRVVICRCPRHVCRREHIVDGRAFK